MQLVVTGLPRETDLDDFLNQFEVLEHERFVRLVDGVFVEKDEQGGISRAESARAYTAAMRLPGVLARVFFGDETGRPGDQFEIGRLASEGGEFGLDKNAIDQIVDLIPRQSLTVFLLLEHLWADEFTWMLGKCGGHVIAHGWATAETLVALSEAHYLPGASDFPGEMWRSKPFRESW